MKGMPGPRGLPLGTLPAVLLVLPPLVWLAGAAAMAASAHGPPLLDPVARLALGRSLYVASLATVLAMVLGGPFGWAVARYRLLARRALLTASLLPVLLPPYAAALAWSLLLAREGALNRTLLLSGWVSSPISAFGSAELAAAVLGLAYWPVVAWFTLFAARSVPRDLDDAARLHLRDGAAARWAAGQPLQRSLPAAALLVFLLALADFGVPNSLGVRTYPVEIVSRFQLDRDAAVVARLAAPLLALVVPLVMLHYILLNRAFGIAESGGPSPLPLRSRGGALAGTGWCVCVLGVSAVIPLAALISYSLPLDTYPEVWAESADHFANTALTAGAGAILSTAAALWYGWSARGRRLHALDLALTLPYAIPASLIGVALIRMLNRPGPPEWLYTSAGALVWLYAAYFYPFAHRSLQPAFGQVDADLVDEGTVLGANGWMQFRHAAWPVLRPYAAIGGGLVAVLAAREMDATALLRVPGGDTIAFRIHDYLHFAPVPKVAALCVVLVALSLAVAAALGRWALRDT